MIKLFSRRTIARRRGAGSCGLVAMLGNRDGDRGCGKPGIWRRCCRTGGFVIVVRHGANLPPTKPTTDPLKLRQHIAAQRNLNDKGKALCQGLWRRPSARSVFPVGQGLHEPDTTRLTRQRSSRAFKGHREDGGPSPRAASSCRRMRTTAAIEAFHKMLGNVTESPAPKPFSSPIRPNIVDGPGQRTGSM